MKRSKIIVHCLVRNEENFIWYALNSVLPYVDKLLVWDTGSDDKTVEIIKSIKDSKISFKEVGVVNQDSFTDIRNKMLSETDKDKFDWLMLLDGDEVWPERSIKKVIKNIEDNQDTQAFFVKTYNVVGDIYHRQPDSAGKYHIKDKKGHLSVRFINLKKIPNLNVSLPHGQQGYFSGNKLIQDLPKVRFVDTFYIHTTHLDRSSQDKKTLKRGFKKKYELGIKINSSDIPQVFYKKIPSFVPVVNRPRGLITYLKCLFFTPLKYFKRQFTNTSKSGY